MRFHDVLIVAVMLIMQIPGKEKPMKIEFLGMKDGCPNTPSMWHALRDAVKELNWDVRIDSLDVNELSQQGDMRAGYGSPSILVNGKDLFDASPPATSAPACRYYRGGVPGTAAIVAKLKALELSWGIRP